MKWCFNITKHILLKKTFGREWLHKQTHLDISKIEVWKINNCKWIKQIGSYIKTILFKSFKVFKKYFLLVSLFLLSKSFSCYNWSFSYLFSRRFFIFYFLKYFWDSTKKWLESGKNNNNKKSRGYEVMDMSTKGKIK